MQSIIGWSAKFSKGIGRYVNSQNVTEFTGEAIQETTLAAIENPDKIPLLLLVIPIVATVSIAMALVIALWGKVRNRPKTEVNSSHGKHRG